MGLTTADGLHGNDEVVTLLARFVDAVCPGPVLLLGQSYGGYLARGLAARRPGSILGLALLCPVAERSTEVPEHRVVRDDPDAYAELDPARHEDFRQYFAVRTPMTARRYRDCVVPGTELVDESALGRIIAGWSLDVTPVDVPTLLVAGRQDSTVGYADTVALLEHYPGATLAVIDGAGHALVHERADLLGALIEGWLQRAA